MDTLKNFDNLPEYDRIKFFEVLNHLFEPKDFESHNKPCSSLQEATFGVCSENLKKILKTVSEKNDPTEEKQYAETKKKQKTLDSWLIKRDNVSTSQNKDLETIEQSADINFLVDTDTVSESFSSVSTDRDNVNFEKLSQSPSSKLCVKNPKSSSSKREKAKDTLSKNDILAVNFNTDKPYNLRSKSKGSKSVSFDDSDSNINKTINSGITSDIDNKCTNTVVVYKKNVKEGKENSRLLQDLPSTSGVDNLHPYNISGDLNSIQSPMKNCNIELSPNKTTYNLRAKRELALKMQETVNSNVISQSVTDQNSVTDQVNLSTTENNSDSVIYSSQLNYEAFCKVRTACNEIGLNVYDILQHENVLKLLSDYENHVFKDGIVLIGTHKSNGEKILPVVYVHKSHLEKQN